MTIGGRRTTARGGATSRGHDDIVVGLDGGRAAAEALRWAAAQGDATGRPLRVVHVWSLSAFEEAAASPEYIAAAAAHARARATQWVLDALGGSVAVITWTLEIVQGAPGPALVRLSRGRALLVVGTHEHTGLRRAIVGSVSHYCLSHAGLPVVAVPASAEPVRENEAARGMLGTSGRNSPDAT